jgi:hypothetical protein
VTLQGNVNTPPQKEAAGCAVQYVLGLTGLSNDITIGSSRRRCRPAWDLGVRRRDGKRLARQ